MCQFKCKIDLFISILSVKGLFCLLLICFNTSLSAQEKDSIVLASTPSDSVSILKDSIDLTGMASDSISLVSDSIPTDPRSNPNVKYSKDGIEAQIDYSARDSIVYDLNNKKIYLYGDAKVNYTTLSMEASYIIFDMENSEVYAEYTLDSLNKKQGVPNFKDKSQEFDAEKMRFNFKSGKGVIYDVTSKYNDLYILGAKAKFVTGSKTDSLVTDDHVFSSDALFTTCNHPEPHYGIRSKKQKVIPNKLVVVGPSNLEIMGVPTPLWLPFGFFPISDKRRAGLIFPRDYEYSPVWGFGLQGIGYYTPLGDKMDLTVTGDLYFKGTYGIHVTSNYKSIYKHNGSIGLHWSDRIVETRGVNSSTQSFSVRWSHTQDRRAHPTRSFTASVNLQTNNYQSLNQNDANSVLQNSLSSNVSYRKTFPDKPFSLSASANHSQNTSTSAVKIVLPTVDFTTETLLPFKRKDRIGKERWYEKISTRYKAQFKNQISATDSTIFTTEALKDAQFGLSQSASANTSLKLLKFLSVNPNVSYDEVWYMKSLEKTFVENIVIDTTITFSSDSTATNIITEVVSVGDIVDLSNFGFQRFGDFSAGFSVNTQIFGTHLSNEGWLRGLRHVMKPSLSFNYRPKNDLVAREQVKTLTYTDIDGEEVSTSYSIFEDGIFGQPNERGTQANICYELYNIFEGKYFTKKDSTEHKFKIFDNVNFGGRYNMAADSLQFSAISMNATTRLFKGISTLNISASWDPYALDEDGTRIDKFQFDQTGDILRFQGGTARLSTTLSAKQIKDFINRDKKNITDSREDEPPRNIGAYGSLGDLLSGFNLSHQYVLRWEVNNETDTIIVSSHTVNIRGSMQLTDQWNVRVGNIGYDFKNSSLTYPDLTFSRKLHCWEMGLSWQAQRGTYSFYLRVNPSSTLNFIKVPWEKRNVDGFINF